MASSWQLDPRNNSYIRTDAEDGTFIRASFLPDVNRWVLAWSESTDGSLLWIGRHAFKTAEDAMAHADDLIVLTPSEAAA